MKTSELVKLLLSADPHDSCEVTVPLSAGLSGSHTKVVSVCQGFDWTAGKLLLETEVEVVASNLMHILEDELDNYARWFYLRIMPTETAKYPEGYIGSYIGPRKPNYKAGDTIKVRQAGKEYEFIMVKILGNSNKNDAAYLKRPCFEAIVVK